MPLTRTLLVDIKDLTNIETSACHCLVFHHHIGAFTKAVYGIHILCREVRDNVCSAISTSVPRTIKQTYLMTRREEPALQSLANGARDPFLAFGTPGQYPVLV